MNPDIDYGTIIDERDGKTYKTVTIGKQTWMAENLNYKTRYSFCYNNKAENCDKYGRLYIWDFAMEACPEGWGLPSLEEFQVLVATIGGLSTAGKVLKSTEGWIGGYVNMGGGQAVYDSLADNGKGTDAFGFSGLPAGYWDVRGLRDDGLMTYFWSSSEYAYNSSVHSFLLHICMENAMITSRSKTYGQSVRCVKDH